jgi:PAS domain-containing protein
MVGGKLWGLVACHHYGPRFVHYEIRAVCELLAESVAMRIAALESFAQAQSELSVRRLEQRIVEVISRDGDWRTALFDGSQSLLQPLNASGAALLFEGEVLTVGEVPGTQELEQIGAWLDQRQTAALFATPSLGLDEPVFEPLSPVASGLVAAPLSSSPGEYLLWFRPARVRTVTWGGNPFKPFIVGNETSELSPRRSFAQWHQQVQGTSDAWLPSDLGAARLIGEILSDVVVQFRSVRVLIAQDQLETVRHQLRHADHPVLIADPAGRIMLTNEAFETLLGDSRPPLQSVADLPPLFAECGEVRGMLEDLVERRHSCRAEVRLGGGRMDARPLLVRGDPVLASPARLLGFVIFVTDLTERRAAEAARRRFQEGVIAQNRIVEEGVREDPTYRSLLSSVLGNAQLAALEITDGVDPSRMPRMLEGVRDSVDRVAELLEHLVSQASRGTGPKR